MSAWPALPAECQRNGVSAPSWRVVQPQQLLARLAQAMCPPMVTPAAPPQLPATTTVASKNAPKRPETICRKDCHGSGGRGSGVNCCISRSCVDRSRSWHSPAGESPTQGPSEAVESGSLRRCGATSSTSTQCSSSTSSAAAAGRGQAFVVASPGSQDGGYQGGSRCAGGRVHKEARRVQGEADKCGLG